MLRDGSSDTLRSSRHHRDFAAELVHDAARP
jgi:hypothetical protein